MCAFNMIKDENFTINCLIENAHTQIRCINITNIYERSLYAHLYYLFYGMSLVANISIAHICNGISNTSCVFGQIEYYSMCTIVRSHINAVKHLYVYIIYKYIFLYRAYAVQNSLLNIYLLCVQRSLSVFSELWRIAKIHTQKIKMYKFIYALHIICIHNLFYLNKKNTNKNVFQMHIMQIGRIRY